MNLVRPGRNNVFLYCKLNSKEELKAQIITDIPIRGRRIHKYLAPKVRDPQIDIRKYHQNKDEE